MLQAHSPYNGVWVYKGKILALYVEVYVLILM